MRSIRRTLVVTLVVLFSVAMAIVAGVLDRIVAQSLDKREKIAADSIETDYMERCREERDKLDQQLLNDARTLSTEMQSLYAVRYKEQTDKFRIALEFSDNLFGTDPLVRGIREAANNRGAVFFSSVRDYFSKIHLEDTLGTTDRDTDVVTDTHSRYFQINISSRTGSVWRSRTMGDSSFALQPGGFDANKLTDWKYDNVSVHGEQVRRVVFRSPIILPWQQNRSQPPRPQSRPGPRGERVDADRPPPPQPGPGPIPPPPFTPLTMAQMAEGFPRISVHCARPLSSIAPLLAEHRSRSDTLRLELQSSIREERFSLRAAVVGIGVATLGLIVVGGMRVVRHGLSPLDRLSDAVSRVSATDFHLSFDRSDLTHELLPIHDRLSQTLLELQRAFEREKQAVADISHELRTPVAALLTTIDVTLRKPRTADQYKGTLEECRAITKQLGQLVERVMTLAYLDAGQTTMSRTTVEAGELAEGCGTIIRPLAEAHGLSFRILAEPVELKTDKDKLREVLMNLLHNAVEYTNPGGSIELAVRPAADNKVAFDVTDTGIGMSDEVKARIFERFYRADPSRTATGVHAGLGLSIVKEYVDRLGGSIRVESSPGKGTTFHLELPA